MVIGPVLASLSRKVGQSPKLVVTVFTHSQALELFKFYLVLKVLNI
jgi:hypothetical protein